MLVLIAQYNRVRAHLFFGFLFCMAAGMLCAQAVSPELQQSVYTQLLQYRIEHDSNYRILRMQADIKEHDLQKVKIQSLVETEIGSGNTQLILSPDKDKGGFTTGPYAKLVMPSYNNTGVRVSAPYSKVGRQKEIGAEVSVSTDIYSKNAKAKKYTVSLAQSAADDARRAQEEGRVLVEKGLLQDIQRLLDDYTTLLDKELNEVKAEVHYAQVKTQGYAPHSIKMRTANLELLGAKRERQSAHFSFSSSYRIFIRTSGITSDEEPRVFLASLCASLPVYKIVRIEAYAPETYKPLVKAELQHAQNGIKRDITLSPFSIGADAGYKLRTTSLGNKSKQIEHTVLGGLDVRFPGGKAYAGIEVPLSDTSSTAVKFSLSFAPFSITSRALEKKNAELEDAIEQLNIEEAREQYQKQLHTNKIAEEHIAWQQRVTADELSIYKQNALDHEQWYRNGLISKTENMQAGLEYKKAEVRAAKAKIATMIFNIDTALLFQQ